MKIIKGDFKKRKNKGKSADFVREFQGCYHDSVLEIDDSLTTVTCQECRREVNAVWVLKELLLNAAHQRNSMQLEIINLEKKLELVKSQNKCRCEHCNKMTIIQK